MFIKLENEMEKTATYNEVISPDLKILPTDYSRRLNISEVGLIEKAVKKYIQEVKQEEYRESFKRAKQDNETSELTEAGIDDFLEMIEK